MGKGKRTRSKRLVRYSELYDDTEDRDDNDLDWEDSEKFSQVSYGCHVSNVPHIGHWQGVSGGENHDSDSLTVKTERRRKHGQDSSGADFFANKTLEQQP